MNCFDWMEEAEEEALQSRVDACRKRLEYARATKEARGMIVVSAAMWAFLGLFVLLTLTGLLR